MKTECPDCGQHIEVDDPYAGETVACPACGQALTLPRASRAIVLEPPASPASRSKSLPPPLPAAPLAADGSIWPAAGKPVPSAAPPGNGSAISTASRGTSAGTPGWEAMPAGSGKIAFLATPKKGHGHQIAVEQEKAGRAALYSGCGFLILVFYLKGGFYGGTAMLILVSLFLGFLGLIEWLGAKHFARKLEALRQSSLNPSNFGIGFEPAEQPSCDVCRCHMAAPLGHLLTTSQIVNSPRFWARYWQIHEPRIKAVGKAQGMNFVPSFRLFAANYDKMKPLHFLFERVAANARPWLVCSDCLSLFTIRHGAPSPGPITYRDRLKAGEFLFLIILGCIFVFSALILLLVSVDEPRRGYGVWLFTVGLLGIGGGLIWWGTRLWRPGDFGIYGGTARVANADFANFDESLEHARLWWASRGAFVPGHTGPAGSRAINVGSGAAMVRLVASVTMMIVGAIIILAAITSLFGGPSPGSPQPSPVANLAGTIIGMALIGFGWKFWK